MRIRTAVISLALLVAGCSGDEVPETTAAPQTSVTTSAGAVDSEEASAPTTSSSSTTIAVIETIDVTVAAGTWVLPREICTAGDGRTGPLEDALAAAGEATRREVDRHTSGWPTTTMSSDVEQWETDVQAAAVEALVLAEAIGVTDDLIASWVGFEQGFADEDLDYPPIDTISRRLGDWQEVAAEVAAGIPDACG